MKAHQWVVKPLVPAEVYTDRTEFLDYLYEAALKAATRRTMSTVSRWIERINQQGVTKWILYLSAIQEGEYLSIEKIQQQLWERDRRDVSQETIRDVLIKLSRGDLLEYLELGGKFRKVSDPILLEFLKIWGRIEVEGQNRHKVEFELQNQYGVLQRRFHVWEN